MPLATPMRRASTNRFACVSPAPAGWQPSTTGSVPEPRQRPTEFEANRPAVRLESQADFLAGVRTHHVTRHPGVFDEDDIREAVREAAAIGDNAIRCK